MGEGKLDSYLKQVTEVKTLSVEEKARSLVVSRNIWKKAMEKMGTEKSVNLFPSPDKKGEFDFMNLTKSWEPTSILAKQLINLAQNSADLVIDVFRNGSKDVDTYIFSPGKVTRREERDLGGITDNDGWRNKRVVKHIDPEEAELKEFLDTLSKAESRQEKIEDDSGIVERIDSSEIKELIGKIGGVFNVPQSARDQGMKTEMLILTNEEYCKRAENYLKGRLKREGKKMSMEAIRENVRKTGGTTFLQDGKPIVLLREKTELGVETSKLHELLHAMTLKTEDVGGFHPTDGQRRVINEAATQILTLSLQHPDLAVEDLAEGILMSQRIKTPYSVPVTSLLALMLATGESKKSYTIKDLANHYFAKEKGFDLMRNEIIKKVKPEVKEMVQKAIDNDLRDVASWANFLR